MARPDLTRMTHSQLVALRSRYEVDLAGTMECIENIDITEPRWRRGLLDDRERLIKEIARINRVIDQRFGWE